MKIRIRSFLRAMTVTSLSLMAASCITPPIYDGGNWQSFIGSGPDNICQEHSQASAVQGLPFYVISARLPDCRGDQIGLTIQRADKLRYGRFNIIPEGRKFPKPETLQANSKLRFEQKQLWLSQVAQQAKSTGGKVILYTHGYNESYLETGARIAKIYDASQFDGPMIQYSWPSHRKVLRYATDTTNLELFKPHFTAAVRELALLPEVKDLTLVSHSLGGQLLLHALETIDAESARAVASKSGPDLSKKITNIIMASPDIDRQIFESIASLLILNDRQIANGRRITVYSSANDKALGFSHVFNGYQRLGATGCDDPAIESDSDLLALDRKAKARCYAALPDSKNPEQRNGLHIVDTSEVSDSTSGHSDFTGSPEACSDFVSVMLGKPVNSEGRRSIGKGNVWRLNEDVYTQECFNVQT